MPPVPHRFRLTLLAADAALSLLACTSSDATPTPRVISTPTPAAPTPPPLPIALINGWPQDATGPLVLYQHEVRRKLEIVVFDLGTARSLATLRLPGTQENQIAPAGTSLLVNRQDSLVAYTFDGQMHVVFSSPSGRHIERFAATPHGSLVALNHFVDSGHPETNVIEVIDLESGEVILTSPQAIATRAGFVGIAGPNYWSQDQLYIALVG